MAAPVLAAAVSAAPSLISAMQPSSKGVPIPISSLTPEQESLLRSMSQTGSQLSPLQQTTLQSMMQGGTAADYSTNALESYYANTIRDPAMQELYSQTLPSVSNRLASKYWSSIRPQEENKAELATRTQLQKTYGELQMQNELAKRQAQEESRMGGLSLLGQLQNQALNTKAFDIVYKPKGGGGLTDMFDSIFGKGFTENLGTPGGALSAGWSNYLK